MSDQNPTAPAAPTENPMPAGLTPIVEGKSAPDANGLVLKQKLECALQLARTVSLDFNNALTSILGHTSFLLSKMEQGHPWRYSLMEVEKSAAQAAEIANELQIFSRQERETPKTPPGNLNLVVDRCLDFFRNKTGAKVNWTMQLEAAPFAVRFDEAKIQQALTKILENAVESLPGGGQINIQTHNVQLSTPAQDCNVRLSPGAYVCIEISDTGSGIEAEVLTRVFEPFFTTKKEGHRGLGLALVYGIVSNHGGGIAISSQPGHGTSARVYLPAEKKLAIDGSGGKVANLHGTETVLVVDDEDMVLSMAETILVDYGYRILTANSGQRALALLSRGEPKVDLVLTDLVMPAMGGRELIDRIRQLVPGTKIVCMSGYIMTGEKLPTTITLRKPFTSAELLTKVKQALIDG